MSSVGKKEQITRPSIAAESHMTGNGVEVIVVLGESESHGRASHMTGKRVAGIVARAEK